MNSNSTSPYETIIYNWSSIKECLIDLNVKIPAHLASKNDDDGILFVIYPGRNKQLFLASSIMCITLDREQNPMNVYFFEEQKRTITNESGNDVKGDEEIKIQETVVNDSNSNNNSNNDDDDEKENDDKCDDIKKESDVNEENTEKIEKIEENNDINDNEEECESNEEINKSEDNEKDAKDGSNTNTKEQTFNEIQPNSVLRRPYVIDPKCKKSIVEMKAVKSLTMSNATQKLFAKFERTSSGSIEPDATTLARRVLRLLEMEFVKNPDFSYKWKNGKNIISCDLLIKLTIKVREVIQEEPNILQLSSPIYVFGDIHGNYTDLMRFSKLVGMHKAPHAMPARYLFLGDYVDRGDYSVEVVAYLFAMKILYPKRIFLLRGNHELQTINCSYQSYGDTCFHGACTKAYGKEDGNNVWWSVQYVFRCLPLAATIDKSIFCTHGGIPRIIGTDPDIDVVEKIESIRRPWDTEFGVNLEEFLRDKENQLVFDLLWSDPAIDPIEPGDDDDDDDGKYPKGFGKSDRGPGSCVFSMDALNEFYARTSFTHIIRAHEATGVDVRMNGTLLTVFSSSGYDSGSNGAAILVNDGKFKTIVMKSL